MGKRVFFSFHYKDVVDFRANVVRRHWLSKPNRDSAGYYDASLWESVKKQGQLAVKRMINSSLQNTSVTCVLIGSDTYVRPWVRYEMLKSFKKGNQIVAVHINSIKGKDQKTKPKGPNPLEYVGVTFSESGNTAKLWEKKDGKWVEYKEIDGSSSYKVNVAQPYRGNGYNFSNCFEDYDWVADNGYNSFSKWVGE